MLTHWNKLLNTDCTVVEVNEHTVYPIFRVGSTSLMYVADKTYINKQISKCEHIDILIREPGDRFVSGINEYCRENNLDVEETWELINQGKLVDRHFAPQYMWLLHLYKFYNGVVTLKPFSSIKEITKVHKGKDKIKKVPVPLLRSFVDVDYKLIEHQNKTIQLCELVERYNHVLS